MKRVVGVALALTLMVSGACAEVYEGTAYGHNDSVVVQVTVNEGKISEIQVTEQRETPMIADKALAQIPAEIVANQSLAVDSVTGATFTSMAVKNAIADAAGKAGLDVAALRKAPVEAKKLQTEDMRTQIVVVGGGMAGLAAAVAAGDSGADVILVEKLDVLGGTLNVAAAYLLTVNSETNDPALDDSLDKVMSFYKKDTAGGFG